MKKLIILQMFLFTLVMSGQKKRVHTVALLPNETVSRIETDFYISEIIDNRLITTNIGIAQKGLLNRKVPAVFSKDFEEEILDYLETVFPKDTTKTALALRINQLLISEHTGALKETGKSIVRLDVLKKIDEDIYGSYGNFSSNAAKNGIDVTGKHDDRIRKVFKESLMQFDSTDWKNMRPKIINIELPVTPKILTEDIQKGFFRTYLELLNNNAINDLEFQIQDRSTREKLHLKDSNRNKLIHFAYHDGSNLYLNASTYSGERHYVKTERFDDFLIFSDVFINQDNASEMSFAFGVLGLLSSNERQTVFFDLKTGKFYPFNQRRMKSLLQNDFPKLYRKYRANSRYYDEVKAILKEVYNELSPEVFKERIRRS